MSTFQILHISDLHINTEENFDRSVVLDPLIERVQEDLSNGLRPEIVIVTGDIAATGIKPEYDLAKEFFGDLLSVLKLPNEHIFIVPGNHDVNRKKYRPKDVPEYNNMKELNDELENEGYREDLLKGMEEYFEFIEANYSHLKSKHGRLLPFVSSYDSNGGNKIGLVGLNSAWMCRKSPDEGEIAIGEYQIKIAMEELTTKGEFDQVINIFHHPLDWLWTHDRRICRKYFNNTILLSGHLHEIEGGYLHDLDGSIYQFQAGGIYVGSESTYPNRYQHITFDWSKDEIILNFRRFDKERRIWCIDTEKGNDGEKTFTLKQPESAISDTMKTEGIVSHSIPVSSKIFTGRKEELERFEEALKQSNLISIEGLGGIGKSEFATKCIEEYLQTDNVVWFDCFPDTKLDSIIDYCGYSDVLKGENKTELARYSGFVDLIERDKMAIILDNFQDVTNESFRDFFKFSERRLKEARFILIAREHPTFECVSVLPVALEGLKKYSVEYAKKVISLYYSDVEIDDKKLYEICNAVDGHPLAINLEIQLLHYGETPNNIIGKLVQAKDMNEELSHRLLDEIFKHPKSTEQEKQLLLNFSIFRNKVFLEAFEYISDDSDKVDILRKLIDKHMIVRYGHLYGVHPLVREFCYQRMENKKGFHIRAYEYLKTTRGGKLDTILEEEIFYHLLSGEQLQELTLLISEKGEDFILLGQTNFLKRMMDIVIEKGIERADFYLYYGDIAQIKGEYDDALKYFEKSFSFNDADEKISAIAYIKYGEMLFRKGDVNESLKYFENGVDICKKNSFKKGEARSLNDIGLVKHIFGELDVAFEKINQALDINKNIPNELGIADNLNNIGNVLSDKGEKDDLEDAMKKYEECLEIRKEIKDKAGMALVLCNIGVVLRRMEVLDGAMTKCEESLKIRIEIGDKAGIAHSLSGIGNILLEKGGKDNLDDALKKYEESFDISEEIGSKSGMAWSLNNIGVILSERGDIDGALIKYEGRLKIENEIGDKRGIAQALHNVGSSYYKKKIFHLALENLLKSIALHNQIGVKKEASYEFIYDILRTEDFKRFKALAEEAYNKLDEDLKPFIDMEEFVGNKTVHVTKSPKRNAPCPCGSGKRYKKCCGRL